MHIVHFADVANLGGIERNLVQLIRETHQTRAWQHSVFADSYHIHPYLKPDILANTHRFSSIKHTKRLKIPRWPRIARQCYHDRWIQRCQPDVGLLWQWFGDMRRVDICRRAGVPRVYWERGLAWTKAGDQAETFLASLNLVLANSYAGKRILQERWEFSGPVVVIPNAVVPRHSMADCRSMRARNRGDRYTFRLGTAARLRSFKGVHLSIHTLKRLRDNGYNAELVIAGSGPNEASLRNLCATLGLESAVKFAGEIDDVSDFYLNIDCYLHPAMREPFGTVCAEAQAYGCPVVTTQVDGMPEVVKQGQTGYCVTPTEPLADYPHYGGETQDVHAQVYDPEADTVVEPRFAAPENFADHIASLIETPELLSHMGESAMRHARETFSWDRHVTNFALALEHELT